LIKDIGSIRPPSVQGGRTAKADLKGVLQGKEKEMASLRSKLELREREVRRLRLQLESLEEIHQKYQEKKQEVTPATPAPHK
jgi:chromosome segregation ATPase